MHDQPEFDHDALPRRLAVLERRLTMLWRIGAVAVAAVLLLCTAALTSQDPVRSDPELAEYRAQRFLLVDGKQRTRGVWETDKDGLPSFRMVDAAGRARASLSFVGDEVIWVMRDDKGENRLGMSIDTGGLPHVVLNDALGRPKLHLSVNAAGRPNLLCRSDDGVIAAGVGVLDDGTGWVRSTEAGGGGK